MGVCPMYNMSLIYSGPGGRPGPKHFFLMQGDLMPKAARYRLCVKTSDGKDITDPKSSRATMFEAIKYLGVANVSKLAPNIVSTDIDSLGKHARAKPPTQMSRERNDESTRIRT